MVGSEIYILIVLLGAAVCYLLYLVHTLQEAVLTLSEAMTTAHENLHALNQMHLSEYDEDSF